MPHSRNIRSQTKEIIFNVYKYFKHLSTSESPAISSIFSKTQEVTAKACGVSLNTVRNICIEANESASLEEDEPRPYFRSPQKKKTSNKKPVTGMDDFNKDILRRTVHEFYDAGQFPTCAKISEALRDKIGYSGSGESTRRLLRSLGFSFKKCNDGRKFLMERSDIVAARIAFLRKMHSLRVNKDTRPIVYLDETWVNQNHTKSFIWQDKNRSGGLKVPLGKGGRLIVCHAGSAKFGFISGAKLVFRSGSSNNDYHSEMTYDVFKQWYVNMLHSLEEGCVIVMDNASYHSVLTEKPPSSNTRKAEIEKWLEEKSIPHDNSKTRNELLALVRLHKQKYRTYELDKISAELGHEVIRLPPYHCQYNPAELIWAQVKKEVANGNSSFRLSNVEQLLHEALDKVSVDNWRKCVQHAERLQEEDFLKEGLRDNVLESIIVTLTDSSESDGSADTDEEEEAEREDGIEAMV